MRAISLVDHIEFAFDGNVARNAIALGDLDNDGCNELVIGNNDGEVAVFKGRKKIDLKSKFTFVCCVAIGDIFNENKNNLIVVTAEGWCHIYTVNKIDDDEEIESPTNDDAIDGQVFGTPAESSKESVGREQMSGGDDELHFICLHVQRIPANAKNILLADVDGDGNIEMVLGLTDRVVRSYRWVSKVENSTRTFPTNISHGEEPELRTGKLVALNKWECANQIGSITLHHAKGQPELLIAQPGGSFMRIKCKRDSPSESQRSDSSVDKSSNESSTTSMVDYQYLGISRMRNRNISTEILGNFRISGDESMDDSTGRPYAVATLDGTIMLVRNEVILWAMAVDHQIFALTKLDVTGTGSDDIVICSWDGQTYILDQEKNSVRFHLEQPVQAFTSGYYNLNNMEADSNCLVYVTFRNTVLIFYDIPLKGLNCEKFKPNLYALLLKLPNNNEEEKLEEQTVDNLGKTERRNLMNFLLYKAKPSIK